MNPSCHSSRCARWDSSPHCPPLPNNCVPGRSRAETAEDEARAAVAALAAARDEAAAAVRRAVRRGDDLAGELAAAKAEIAAHQVRGEVDAVRVKRTAPTATPLFCPSPRGAKGETSEVAQKLEATEEKLRAAKNAAAEEAAAVKGQGAAAAGQEELAKARGEVESFKSLVAALKSQLKDATASARAEPPAPASAAPLPVAASGSGGDDPAEKSPSSSSSGDGGGASVDDSTVSVLREQVASLEAEVAEAASYQVKFATRSCASFPRPPLTRLLGRSNNVPLTCSPCLLLPHQSQVASLSSSLARAEETAAETKASLTGEVAALNARAADAEREASDLREALEVSTVSCCTSTHRVVVVSLETLPLRRPAAHSLLLLLFVPTVPTVPTGIRRPRGRCRRCRRQQ